MNKLQRIERIALLARDLDFHIKLRRLETRGEFISIKFDVRMFNTEVMSKEAWHKHVIGIAASYGCEYVNYLMTDYDTKIMYFFTNPGHIKKTAMEQLQEASYAR